ncbi:MAG: response regulator [Nannocystaceae bacterium]
MPSTAATRVLLVDSDAAHVARLLAESHGGSPFELVHANAASIEEVLAHTAIDAVVLDLDGDEDANAQIIGEVERRFDGVPLVGVSQRVDDARVASACHLGATAILAKPFDLAALAASLRAPAGDAGFSGSCFGVPTAQLLTLHCAAGHDGVLHLRVAATTSRPERRGSIFLEGGQPVHATAGGLVGADAVHAMLTWRDAEATWIGGVVRAARTIVGRWEGMLATASARTGDNAELERMVAVAHPEVVEKLARLAQTPDVLGAFLLRHAEVIAGRCVPALDEQLAARALCRLAHVFFDVEAQPHAAAQGEIQAVVGDVRLVLDRIGPVEAGFQVGVVVRQAAPVCKSLRRLLRQIDSAFVRVTAPREKVRARDEASASVRPRVPAVA